MRYTRTAIGALTRQYRSVLRKCWLINMGLFALGLSVAKPVEAQAAPTLDEIKVESVAYIGSDHQHYTLDTTQGDNTQSIVIGSTTYYYTPSEATDALNSALVNLANTGGYALTESDSSDYIFFDGTKYWKYDSSKLPTSTWIADNGTSSDYDYVTYDVGAGGALTPEYHTLALKNDGSAVWTDNGSTEPSGYTWAYDNIAASDIAISGNTVTGAIRMKMPHNGETPTDWNRYFTYTYTVPAGYTLTQTRINNTIAADGSNVQNKVFSGISGSSDGGAIYNTQDKSTVSIIADFIGNSVISSSYYTYGGAIYNYSSGSYDKAKIGSITGDFIGNNAKEGGAIYNKADGTYGQAKIGNITGDFIGNSDEAIYNCSAGSETTASIGSIAGDFVGNSGRAIYNQAAQSYEHQKATAEIGSIVGDFIGNSGGAISNRAPEYGRVTIYSIVGDFIGNSASTGGGIYNKAEDQSSASIGSVVGNFIGNSAREGGAIYNNGSKYDYAGRATIDSIVGDFIGNSAISTSSTASGGAIYNWSNGTNTKTIIGSILGDFIGNSVKGSSAYGGAIYNYSNGSSNYIASINSVMGDFIGNSVITNSTDTSKYAKGGAIYNNVYSDGSASISITNANFLNNYAQSGGSTVQGGAIYTNPNMTLIADGNVAKNSGISTISGNYVSNDSGTTKNYEAIYVDSSTATFTFNAVNGGKFVINDYINGAYTNSATGGRYTVSFNGENAGDILMNNKVIGANVVLSNENVLDGSTFGLENAKLNLNNGTLGEMSLDTLTASTGTNYLNIDLDWNTTTADHIKTANASTGTLTLYQIDQTGDAINDQIIQVIQTQDANLKLALDSNLSSEHIISSTEAHTTYDEIQANTDWGDAYQRHDVVASTTYGKFSLATTDTTNDSVKITTRTEGGESTDTSMGDTLALVAQNVNGAATFNNTGTSDYTVTGDLGELNAASLSIDGAGYGIVGGGNEGITVGSGKTLNLTDVNTVSGFDGNFATNTAGTVNITANTSDSSVSDNIYNAGTLSLLANTDQTLSIASVSDAGTATGTVNVGASTHKGTVDLAGTLKADNLVFNGGTLSLNTDNALDVGTFTVNGCDLDLITDAIETQIVTDMVLNNDMTIGLDAGITTPDIDRLAVSGTFTNTAGKSLIIDAINLISGSGDDMTVVSLTDNADLRAAYKLSNGILRNITAADGVSYIVGRVEYDQNTGNITFNRRVALDIADATIDTIHTASAAYLSGEHNHYNLTTTKGDNTQSIVIDGTTYYYTPDEATEALNTALVNLANTGSVAMIAGNADNYVFKAGDKYYTYWDNTLPISAWKSGNGTSSDYDYITYNVGTGGALTPEYHKFAFKNDDKITWADSGSTEPSGYTWANDNVAGSNVTVSGNTITGAIRMIMPHNGENPDTWNRYFTYTYTIPTGYNLRQTRINDTISADGSNVRNKVFAGINYSQNRTNGGVIYNTQNKSGVDIIADFVGNKATSTSAGETSCGGTISNYISSGTAAIGNITGDFIGNSASSLSYAYSGAIYNYAYQNSTASIGNITGDFIGNTAYSSSTYSAQVYGGAISNHAGYSTATVTIGNITGDFIGNSATAYVSGYSTTALGGAIYNYGNLANINNITGDFIGNSASGSSANNSTASVMGGAIYNAGAIGNITGDFISNRVSLSNSKSTSYIGGGAIYNRNGASINSIVGNFIDNNTTTSSTYSYGGAILNYSDYTNIVINSIVGDFVGNSATTSSGSAGGGAISNLQTSYQGINNIGSIVGDFIGNSVTSTVSSYGGAIYNNSTNASIGSIVGDFVGNSAISFSTSASSYTQGGAIFSADATISNITNANFLNNYAQSGGGTVQGGAIWAGRNMTLNADGDVSTISGNYVSNDGGLTKNYEAIYVPYTSTYTFTFNAVNGGLFVVDDYINGNLGYRLTFTGDESGTVNYNNKLIGAPVVNINNVDFNWNMSGNDVMDTSDLTSLTIDGTTVDNTLAIDLDATAKTADKITTTALSSGVLNVNNINRTGTFDDWTDTTKVQIIQNGNGNSTLQLALVGDAAAAEFFLRTIEGSHTEDDVIVAENSWDTEYESTTYHDVTDVYGQFGLATTTTSNDSIGLTIHNVETHTPTGQASMGDTLALVAQNVAGAATFDNTGTSDYTVTGDLGTLNATSLSIDGAGYGIVGGNNEGLTIGSGKTLNLTDVNTVSGFNGNFATNTAGTVNITANTSDSSISNNIYNAGTMSLLAGTGNTLTVASVTDAATAAGTINLGDASHKGTVDLTGTMKTQNLVFDGGTLSLNTNNALDVANFTVNGCDLDLITEAIETQTVENMVLNNDLTIGLDADITAPDIDRLAVSGAFTSNSHSLIIDAINLTTGTGDGLIQIALTDNADLMAAYTLSSSIKSNITKSAGVDYTVYTVKYNPTTGILTFNALPDLGTATVDVINGTSRDYLDNAHAQYTLSSTATGADGEESVIIDGTTYYFTPNETGEQAAAKNAALVNLAHTGSAALKEVTSGDNYVFFDGTKYWTYTKFKLPVSAWNPINGTSSDYDYITYNVGTGGALTPEYHKFAFKNDGNAVWTDNGSTKPSGYTWADDNAAASNITVSGNTISGAIRMRMPHNGTTPSGWNRYFTYTYTIPSGYTLTQTRINNTIATDGSNVQNKVFAGIAGGSTGGAIYNTQDKSTVSIIADFIGNNIPGANYYSYGGAIYNSGTIDNIVGNFIGNIITYSNSHSHGGAIYNSGTINSIVGDFIGNSITRSNYTLIYGGAIYNSGTIDNIVGDFIGNSTPDSRATPYGGAIYNDGTINSIVGDFIGNSAATTESVASGGAIYNYSGTINSIVGDFIGNTSFTSSSLFSYNNSYGGAIHNSGTDATIGSIIGDFIGNSSSSRYNSYGGAIYNTVTISSIVGEFIGNSASTSSTDSSYYVKGGAIFNGDSTIGSIINTNFLNNYAQSAGATVQGGAIYTNQNMTLIADGNVTKNGGVSTISGNWISNNNGSTKQYEAIYVNSYTQDSVTYYPTFTFNAVNFGQFLINDYINGATGYGLTFTGDDTGEVDYNNKIIGGAVVNINDVDFNWNMSGNNVMDTSVLTSLTIDGTTVDNTFAIDLNATAKTADKITTTALSSGVLNLNTLNITGDFTTWNGDTKVQIIQNGDTNSTLQLALDSSITTPERTLGSISGIVTYDDIIADNNWADVYQQHTTDGAQGFGKLTLATTTTENDSIGVVVTRTEGGTTTDSPMGDTLALVAQNVTGAATFDNTGTSDYTVTGDLGELNAASLSIDGAGYGIVGGNNEGLTIGSGKTLNLTDVNTVSGFNGNFATNNAGTVNITANTANSTISNNIYNSGTMSLLAGTGNTLTVASVTDAATAAGTINLGDASHKGTVDLTGTLKTRNLVFNGGTLSLNTDNALDVTRFTVNGCDLDLITEAIETQTVVNMILNNDLTIGLDADITAPDIDRLAVSGAFTSNSHSLIIDAINLTTGAGDDTVTISLTDNASLRNAYTLSKDILSHITRSDNVNYIVGRVEYDATTGNIIFNRRKVLNIANATIDKIHTASAAYLSGEHNHYNLTTTKGDNTQSIVIDGTTYYYTPDETTEALNTALVNLANIGSVAMVEGTAGNYVFKAGDKYYTYWDNTLPISAWKSVDGTSSDYDYITYNVGQGGALTPVYKTFEFKNGENLAWTDNGSTEPSGYTWADDNIASSNITVSGNTITGAIRVKMPHNGENPTTWNRYFTYTYTIPTGYTLAQTRINDTIDADGSNVQNKVFAGISGSASGGVIYNTRDLSDVDIIADFIDNSIVSPSDYDAMGGVIYNFNSSAKIGNIIGDFIGNYIFKDSPTSIAQSYGGVINNYYGTIGNITGDFIGNGTMSHTLTSSTGSNADSEGGVIYNRGTIGNITGDFIGNSIFSSPTYGYAYVYGGAIDNLGTIGNITGDFISNSATGTSSGSGRPEVDGGAIANGGTIGDMTGDFINNSVIHTSALASYSAAGGAIYNKGGTSSTAKIGNITGDFIGNSAVADSTGAQGGAIANYGTIGTSEGGIINANFLNNYAQSAGANVKGGAIYTSRNMTLTADGNVAKNSGISTISGNYVSNNGGTTKNYEAIYVDYNGATFTFNAVNDGQFIINDYANGEERYGLTFTGDSSGEIDYNNVIKGTPNLTVSNVDFDWNTQNENIDTESFYSITISDPVGGAIKRYIDVDIAGMQADTITAEWWATITAPAGSIIINAINLTTGTGEDSVDIALTNNSNLKAAYALSDGIMSNITQSAGVDYTVYNVKYNPTTGILTFNALPDLGTATIDVINGTSRDYLDNAHAQYTLSATATGADGEESVIIDGTTYYFTPHEASDDKNVALVNLVHTGMDALK